jgi:AGZA family xanthine/uracil permease-like MFS transporter
MWASTMVFIIDRRLDKAAAALFTAAALSFCGFIHAPRMALNAAPAYTLGYVEIGIICLAFHFLRDRITTYQRRYDYV